MSDEVAENIKKFAWRPWILAGGVLLLFVVGTGGVLAYAAFTYQDKTWPGMYVGTVPVGGLGRAELTELLTGVENKLRHTDIAIKLNSGGNADEALPPREFVLVPTESLVNFNVAAETDRLLGYGKRDPWYERGWHALLGYSGRARVTLGSVQVDEKLLTQELLALIPTSESPVDAGLRVTSIEPLRYEITSSSPGLAVDFSVAATRLKAAWSKLEPATLTLTEKITPPRLTEAEVASAAAAALPRLFAGGPIVLQYPDSTTRQTRRWLISGQDLADWLTVDKPADTPVFTVRETAIGEFLHDKVLPSIQQQPRDAVWQMNASSTRVIKFVNGRPGVTVDVAKTRAAVAAVIQSRWDGKPATSTQLVAAEVAPKIRTEDTNDLGIKELLGTGYSNFSGSPKNRILNIRNAVTNKLYGTLVKPDEEFSLVKNLKPFTIEAGYLPELVIKGDRITPEVAGGLCQVGTTMFRTSMNSGMPITARTNHGLVVSYYNDPANGNPGTDATIYDGWPDFRFKNDTGHHILITTDMNTKNGELHFSFWGTSDGRKGYYIPPKVLSRTPAGPFITIETDDLPPGKKECQSTHPGAVAAFDYIRELPDGKKEVREFKSVYRSVSARCFVGRDPNAVPSSTPAVATPASSEVDPAVSAPTEPVVPESPAAEAIVVVPVATAPEPAEPAAATP